MMEPILASTTSWPEAAIAIAGVLLVTAVVVTVVWQGFSAWKARIAATNDHGVRELAERTEGQLRAINRRLDEIAARDLEDAG